LAKILAFAPEKAGIAHGDMALQGSEKIIRDAFRRLDD
jgi:hypothetical protein